jgi:hypothetical protein
MMRRILIVILTCLPACAFAQPATNFPSLSDYPGPVCSKPGEQPKRPSAINAAEVDRYNALLAKYNKTAHDYVVCINLYVRNADNDMDLIRKKSRAAVDEANR